MNPTYKILHEGDYCECQLCFSLVANNSKARDGHDAWHLTRFENELVLFKAAGFTEVRA